jgi:signal transduction histidine kinase
VYSLAKTVYSAIRVHQAEQEEKLANQLLKESNELLRRNNKELEQQRQQIELQNLQLQEAYRLKSEFLATISHELRTPMNAIMGFAQLLLRQYPDPLTALQIDIVQRIFNNSQNLLSMINEVLDFSKIEAGQMAFSLTEFDISVLVQMTVEELRSLAHHKNLSLQTSIEVTEPILISDSNFLRRIVINLLSNTNLI